jgi:hypothetical protein
MNTPVPRNENGDYDEWLTHFQAGDTTLPFDEHPRPSAPSPTFSITDLANFRWEPFVYDSPLSPPYRPPQPARWFDFVSNTAGPELGTEDCPICLDTIATDQVTTHCGHTFHRACLEQNIQHHSTKCPMCRHQFELKPVTTIE